MNNNPVLSAAANLPNGIGPYGIHADFSAIDWPQELLDLGIVTPTYMVGFSSLWEAWAFCVCNGMSVPDIGRQKYYVNPPPEPPTDLESAQDDQLEQFRLF